MKFTLDRYLQFYPPSSININLIHLTYKNLHINKFERLGYYNQYIKEIGNDDLLFQDLEIVNRHFQSL